MATASTPQPVNMNIASPPECALDASRALGTRRHVLGISTRSRFNALSIYTINHAMHISPRAIFPGIPHCWYLYLNLSATKRLQIVPF